MRARHTVNITELKMSDGLFFVYVTFIGVSALSTLCSNELSIEACFKRRVQTPDGAG